MARRNRYTVYDVMDDRGVFDANPANAQSPLYKGPVPFPRMLYHPKGEMRVTQKAEVLRGPYGPEKVGEQREIVHKTVHNQEELDEALLEGWHMHPAQAMAAAGLDAPAMFPEGHVKSLEDQIKALNAQLAQAKQHQTPAKTKTA